MSLKNFPDYSYHQIRKTRSKIIQHGSDRYQNFPWRSPQQKWHGLLAEILLQRTRANNVIPVYKQMVKAFPNPQDLANATISEIGEFLYPLGLAWRAKYVHAFAVNLTAQSKVPENLDSLLSLPGVGPYAANAY